MDFDGYVQSRGLSLQRLAFVLCADHHLAEDLTQTALAKAFTRWHRVSRLDHPDSYVRRILVRSYLSRQRSRGANELPSVDLQPQRSDSAQDIADGVVIRDSVRSLLHALPPRAKAVIVLRYFADLDDARIADLLSISPSAVRSTTSRALDRLRKSAAADMEW